MKTLIIYGSQYGTTKRYAERFAEMTGFPVISYEDINALSGYERFIYFGGLYAGGVKGLKNAVKRFSLDTKLIIVTVGLADVCDLLKSAFVFHLRGGIDYQKLSFKHKTMMTLLYNKIKNLPEDKKTAEDKALIETFNSKVDFVDFDSLNPIAEVL